MENTIKVDAKTLYNQSRITLEICEDILNRTCFYNRSEYELRLEEGRIILDIFSQPSVTEYEIFDNHLGI
jgi:hypothetical protein